MNTRFYRRFSVSCAVILSLVAGCAPKVGAQPPAKPALKPPSGTDLVIGGDGTGDGQIAGLRDLTFDAHNALYILDTTRKSDGKTYKGGARVQKFDAQGQFLQSFSLRDETLTDEADDPARIAVDGKGNIFVSKPLADRVEEYDAAGKPVRLYAVPRAFALTVWQRNGVETIAAVANNREIVKGAWQYLGGEGVFVLHDDGKIDLLPFAQPLQQVFDATSDKQGHLYLLGSARRDKYAYDATDSSQIYKLDAQGKVLDVIGAGTKRRNEDGSELQYTLALDAQNNLYSMTLGNPGKITRFDAALSTVTQRPAQSAWNDAWSFNAYTPMAIDANNRLWLGIPGRHLAWRVVPDFLDAGAKGVTQKSAQLLGFDASVSTSLPYNIAYDLKPLPLEFVVAPSSRRVEKVGVRFYVYDMDKHEVGKGTFDLPLQDGQEARHDIAFTPPQFGWYEVECEVQSGGKTLTSLAQHLGVTPRFAGMETLEAGESKGGLEDDLPRIAFAGLTSARLHATKSLDKLDADLTQAKALGLTAFVQMTDKKADLTPERARELATRFKGRVQFWEVMNEPNFSMSAEDYTRAFVTVATAIKEVDPQAQVMGPSTVNMDLGWLRKFYAGGGGKLADIIALHDYEGHESISPEHWTWKIGQVRKIMAQNGDSDKPVWQTERAISGVRGGVFQPASQAVRVSLHTDLLQTLGIAPNHNNLYYVNEGGYADVPSYIWSRFGPHPAALAMRTRAAMTQNREFAGALDFGPTGNEIFMGLRFLGPDGDTFLVRNLGTSSQTLNLKATGANVQVVDSWGNESALPLHAGQAALEVGQMPVYLRMTKGQSITIAPLDWGRNVASGAQMTYSGAMKGKLEWLSNGEIETYHEANPLGGTDGARIWSGDPATPDKPQTLELSWPQAQKIHAVVLRGVRADNQFCALLDFDLQAQVGGNWKTLNSVRSPLGASDVARTTDATVTAWYQDDNLWPLQFAPVTTSRLRLIVRRTTLGFAPDDVAAAAVQRAWGKTPEARVMLREVEVYAAP